MKRIRNLAITTLLAGLACPASILAGGGIVALQTAAPSCANDSGDTYVDCGNGTVTDNRTGLVWLQRANCLGGFVNWHAAMDFVSGLADMPDSSAASSDDCGLRDGSSPGEWRLPSRAEWQTMIADALALGCFEGGLHGGPAITNDAGDDCWEEDSAGSSFLHVTGVPFWSSSTYTPDPTGANGVALDRGFLINNATKDTNLFRIWPVRGGQ